MALKNNRAPVLSNIKLYASFHQHMWIQTGVTVRNRLSGVVTYVTLTFALWPWPFAWTSALMYQQLQSTLLLHLTQGVDWHTIITTPSLNIKLGQQRRLWIYHICIWPVSMWYSGDGAVIINTLDSNTSKRAAAGNRSWTAGEYITLWSNFDDASLTQIFDKYLSVEYVLKMDNATIMT